MADGIPEIEVGDWVLASEGYPPWIKVRGIGTCRNQACALDDNGECIVFGSIVEVRKPDGRRWLRDGGAGAPRA